MERNLQNDWLFFSENEIDSLSFPFASNQELWRPTKIANTGNANYKPLSYTKKHQDKLLLETFSSNPSL